MRVGGAISIEKLYFYISSDKLMVCRKESFFIVFDQINC